MAEIEYKATKLIAETFEERGVKFSITNIGGRECVNAGFKIECGPSVMLRFISTDNGNDVAVRAYALVTSVPVEKRRHLLEACNTLNCDFRYLKFCLDSDNDVNVEYDFPVETEDNCVGMVAFELLARSMDILNKGYKTLMKALFT